MTRNDMIGCNCSGFWSFSHTDIHRFWAARMERTTRRWIKHAWNFALRWRIWTRTLELRVRYRHCAQQSLGKRLKRLPIKVIARCRFNNSSKIHDCHTITHVSLDGQFMGDRKIR